MKKIMSTFMLLLVISSNFFYYSFADEETIIIEEQTVDIIDLRENEVLNDENPEIERIWTNTDKVDEEIDEKEDETTIVFEIQEIENSELEVVFEIETRWVEDNIEPLPNLIISEVFFWWSKERIEVYNAWNDDFSGDLIFYWANAWSTFRSFSWVEIAAGWIQIFGNSAASAVLWDIPFLIPDKQFQISDGGYIDIQLMFSGENLDSFQADSTWINKNTSFHKLINTREVLATTTWYSQNTTDEYFANPWYVFLQEIEPEIPDEPELTWDTIDTPNLKITEIYFDWDDNRFEITNLWNSDFSWDLTLNWNLNFTISTQIPAWISKVFANSLAMFENLENIEILSNNISFNNEEINLNLIRSWEILDTFFVHESWVNYLQEAETSFEKVWNLDNRTTTYVWLNFDRIFNTNRWIAANPTTYFTQWENMKDVTQDRNWNEIYTGENYDLPIDCDDFWNDYTATISEVYYWNSTYPSYVELKIDDDISDYSQIFLSGSAVSSPAYFNTRWIKKNTFILLTNNSTWYDEWRESKSNIDFNLNSSWWLILYWVDSYWEDILDIVYISRSSAGNSVYMWTESLECAWVFDYSDKFSPWLTIWQSQFIQITPDPIIQYIQVWWWGWSCSNDETLTFDSSSFSSSEIQISAIKYYWNYQILKLKNKTNSDINLREYYLQFLDWTTKNIQWNTLFAKSTMSFVWNYWLPTNQDFCVNLMKDWEVVDRYCRNSLTKASAQDEENIRNQLTFWEDLYSEEWEDEEWVFEDETENPSNTWNSLQTNTIKIIDIDYDPEWADWDNESVTLLLLTWTQVDLSDYKFYYTKDWKTQKTKVQIQWILSYWNKQTFKWWFAFPNSTDDKKSVTVNLISPDGKVVDTYIYNPNKITEIPAGDYEIISVIDGDTAKINYDWQEITIRFAGIDAPESSALRCGKGWMFWTRSKAVFEKSDWMKNDIFWASKYGLIR